MTIYSDFHVSSGYQLKEVNEMELKKDISAKTLGMVNTLALKAVKSTANSACLWLCHQPEFPEAANKFKKVK